MAIEWDETAVKLGFESEEAMWQDYYIVRKLSITQLAERLGVSRNTVRAALERLEIPVRSRGGPNNQKLDVTDELVDEIRRDGIAAVAKRRGLSYTTVYKRLYHVKGLTPKDVAEEI